MLEHTHAVHTGLDHTLQAFSCTCPMQHLSCWDDVSLGTGLPSLVLRLGWCWLPAD